MLFFAEYRPQRRETLSPQAAEWIGWAGAWEPAFQIEDGPHAGEFAWRVRLKSDGTYGGPRPPADVVDWVPQSDLKELKLSAEGLAALEQVADEILRGKFGEPE